MDKKNYHRSNAEQLQLQISTLRERQITSRIKALDGVRTWQYQFISLCFVIAAAVVPLTNKDEANTPFFWLVVTGVILLIIAGLSLLIPLKDRLEEDLDVMESLGDEEISLLVDLQIGHAAMAIDHNNVDAKKLYQNSMNQMKKYAEKYHSKTKKKQKPTFESENSISLFSIGLYFLGSKYITVKSLDWYEYGLICLLLIILVFYKYERLELTKRNKKNI